MTCLGVTKEAWSERYLGLPGVCGQVKSKGICIFKRQNLATDTGMERKNAFQGGEGDSDQGMCTGSTPVCHDMF